MAVKPETIHHVASFLEELPQKPKEDLSLREAVNRMRETIQAALAKGYGYPELAKLLTEKGIKISSATLKNYVPSGKRSATAAKAKTRKTRKTQADDAMLLEALAPAIEPVAVEAPLPTVTEEVVAEPTPTKLPRRRTKTTPTPTPTPAPKASGRSKTPRAAAKKTTTTTTTAKKSTPRGRKQSNA